MYSKIVRHVVLPLAQLYLKNNFYNHLKQLEKSQWYSQDELKQIQWRKLNFILNHAYENVPMYRQKFKSVDMKPEDIKKPGDMLKLPIVTKEDFRNNFPEKCTAKNMHKTQWIYNSTSGSTGNPFEFIMDKNLVGVKNANYFRYMSWASVMPGDKFIKLWGQHDEEFKKELFTSYALRQLELSCFDIDSRKNEYYNVIRKYKPKAIESYTSALVKLCMLMRDDGIDINVESAIVSAETLYEKDRKLIEDVLSCKVFNRYGSREFGNVAQECEEQCGLHISSECFYIEIINNGETVSPSESGKLIITSFDNLAMPFIRYDIGDMGTPTDEICSCGRGLPLVKSVDGRITEFITMPSGKLVPYLYFNYFFEQYGAYIKQFQVIQKQIDFIEINIITTDSYTSKIEEKILESLKGYLGEEIGLSIKLVDGIPLTKAGKQVCVISNVKK